MYVTSASRGLNLNDTQEENNVTTAHRNRSTQHRRVTDFLPHFLTLSEVKVTDDHIKSSIASNKLVDSSEVCRKYLGSCK